MKTRVEDLSDGRKAQIEGTMSEVSPRVLPNGWICGESMANACWYQSRQGLRVLVEVEEQDKELWLHMSMSRKDRLPNYADMVEAKSIFIGDERRAFHFFPKKSEHYNLHPFCLHLYSPIERDPLPADFRLPSGDL